MGYAPSLTPIISENEFLPLVKEKSRDIISVLSVLKRNDSPVNRLFYFTLLQEAEKLEEFLDDHGARGNLSWLYFVELVACVRNFAMAGFHLFHILDRYPEYLGAENDFLRKSFTRKTHETLDYFASVLINFYEELLKEAGFEGIEAEFSEDPTKKWSMTVTPQLPYTIEGSATSAEEERLISVAQSYRRIFKNFRQNKLQGKLKATTMTELVPCVINETMMAQVESLLHNIQSEYDSYIRGGDIEKENPHTRQLRGLTAIPMHLFESLQWLTHFYERHESSLRQSEAKDRISELVDDAKLYECIVGYGLKFCGRFLVEGNTAAERILSSFVNPVAMKLPLPQPQGMHARPSTYVSLIVQEHGTDVFMVAEGERYDCRSVLSMMEAGGALADSGATHVVFEGDDRVLADIAILSEHNYCEDQEVPRELRYLRISRNL